MTTFSDTVGKHQREGIGGCACGWNELGGSHIAHVNQVLREARVDPPRDEDVVKAETWREAAEVLLSEARVQHQLDARHVVGTQIVALHLGMLAKVFMGRADKLEKS